jgi:hypothetical protein
MPDLAGHRAVLGLRGARDRRPEVRVNRDRNLLAPFLGMGHFPRLELSRGTLQHGAARLNAPPHKT